MAEDVKEGIVKVVVDRVANPLLFGFGISWCFVNYQFFILVVRVNDYAKLVSILKSDLFSDTKNYQFFWVDVSSCFYYGILIPVLLSVLYVVFSPVIMLGITSWQLFCESRLRKIKNYFDDKFARTREEFDRLESSLKDMVDKREIADQKILELKGRIEKIIEDRDVLEINHAKAIAEAKVKNSEMENELRVLNGKINSKDEKSPSAAFDEVVMPKSNGLIAIYDKYKNQYKSLRSNNSRLVFEKIIKGGGQYSESYVPSVGMTKLKFEHCISELSTDRLISSAGGLLYLTASGRAIAVEIEDLI